MYINLFHASKKIVIMDSSKKMPWNSSTKLNDNSRDNSNQSHQRLNYEQKNSHSEVTHRLKSLSDAINETTAENVALGKEVASLLSTLEIEPQSLPREIKDGLDKVIAIFKKEDLVEINETALAINMEQRKRNELFDARENRNLKKKYTELCSQYASLEEKLQKVQEKVSSLTEMVSSAGFNTEIGYSDLIHNATKLNTYKKTCDSLDAELADMHVTDDYSDKVHGKYKQCMQATGELAEINKLLNQYGNLPPDILEAKAFLEQRENRRQELKKMLDEKLN